MAYFDRHLVGDEQIFFRTYLQPFTFSNILYVFPMFWIWLWNNLTNDLVITDKRLAFRRLSGLSIINDEIQARFIRSADTKQSIIGGLFNYGDVIVTGSNRKHCIDIIGVKDPGGLQKAILDMMHGTFSSGGFGDDGGGDD